MVSVNKYILSILVLFMIALSGCISLGDNKPPTPTHTAIVGVPTEEYVPVDTPKPTPAPTVAPTPTPRPPPVSIYNVNFTWTVDSGAAQYAMRHDTATFKIKNTGDSVLYDLNIVYDVVTAVTATGNGQTSVTDETRTTTYSIGTLSPGESKDVKMQAPLYAALLEANVTITAKWRDGSLPLFRTKLEPNFISGSSLAPSNDLSTKMYGSSDNW